MREDIEMAFLIVLLALLVGVFSGYSAGQVDQVVIQWEAIGQDVRRKVVP